MSADPGLAPAQLTARAHICAWHGLSERFVHEYLETGNASEAYRRAYSAAGLKMGQPGAMVAASMGRAKIAGLFVDKKEVGTVGEFDHMSDEELRQYIAQEAVALGIVAGERKDPVD